MKPNAESEAFYTELPGFKNFSDLALDSNFHDAPADWWVVVADIKGSTRAIEEGRYKEVNILGASSIIAVLNQIGDKEIPYVFGGDGASFLIPDSLRPAVGKALRNTQKLAIEKFDLELRAGMAPVHEIQKRGSDIRVAKFEISSSMSLAMFSGGGLALGEKLIKDQETAEQFAIESSSFENEDNDSNMYEGLECRWEPVKSKRGETLSLMVVASTENPANESEIYAKVLKAIGEIYGKKKEYTPIEKKRMNVTLNSRLLSSEKKVRTFHKNIVARIFYPAILFLSCLLGRMIFKFGLKIGDMDGADYLQKLEEQSDFQKFDDTLRMILDSSPEQRKKLSDFLEAEKNNGKLHYGLHISDSALMTCLVFDRKEHHLHFVDGSNGGYALAAKQLKAQIKENSL